ncbi:MAG: hypothetical protein AAB642_03805 [Patescibacteria group bacterium]
MAVFNFLNLSPTYCATVGKSAPRGREILMRRDVLTAEAGLTNEYQWPTKKADIPRITALLAAMGITANESTFKYDHGTLRTTYLFLTGNESVRAAILVKMERKDPYCFAVSCFLKDGITSWEAVQQLSLEPVEVNEEKKDIAELSLTEESQPSLTIEDQVDETITSPDVLLRLARDEFEHIKRGAALAVQLLERLAKENEELREHLDTCDARIELLEVTITGAATLKDVPELQQFLGLTDKFAQEEAELENTYEQLPCSSPHHGGKKVVYKDRFLDTFRELDRIGATRVVKQLKTLFNKGPEYPSLQTKRIWHEDLPGTPKSSWSCKAGSGGPHALRFTWGDTDDRITVFGIYPRNDLF